MRTLLRTALAAGALLCAIMAPASAQTVGGSISNPVPVDAAAVAAALASTPLAGQHGGTGVNNSGKTITLGGNLATTGAFNATFAIPGTGTWTFPTAGSSLAALGANTFTGAQTINNTGAGALIIGTTTTSFGGGAGSQFNSSTNNLTFGDGVSIGWADATASNRPTLTFYRSRGTLASPANINASDVLGHFSYYSRVAGAFVESATVRTLADDTSGNARIEFFLRSGGTVALRTTMLSDGSLSTSGTVQYLGTASGTDTITITPSPALTVYTTGACYTWKSGGANTTTTPTFNANSLGAKTIVKRVSTALAAGDIPNGMFMQTCYNGTNMQLMNPVVP